MFSQLGQQQEQDQCSPFLSISQYFPAPVDTKFSKIDPSEYRVVPDLPLNAIARRTGKKRKAVRFAIDATIGPTLIELDPSIRSSAHHFGTQMQVDDDEEPAAIEPAQIGQYESKTPVKKATDYPGHNLKKRIFKQIEDG